MNRAVELLNACKDLLQKQNETIYVLNMLETTVFYDGVECDGSCLLEDIEIYLEETEEKLVGECKPQTNADRIRSMSDDELAKERIDRIDMYTHTEWKEYIGDFNGIANSEEEALRKELEWLQSEVKGSE